MLHPDSRFHAVPNDQEKHSFLFIRLRYPVMELLNSDRAYHASVSSSLATIAGCLKPPTKQLISLLLSIPKTTAKISSDELQLRCTDKSSVQLLVSLPITPIPAKPVLQALHSGLMLAAASLEGALLETLGTDMSTEVTGVTPESLEVLHGPVIAGGQPVELYSLFRRVAVADVRLHAARAFAVAQTAERVRGEILGKRKERKDQERRKRQRERERVREAKKLILTGQGAKRPKPSLFDIDNDSPNSDEVPKANMETNVNDADTPKETAPLVSSANTLSREQSNLNQNTETTVRTGNSSVSDHLAKLSKQHQTRTAKCETDEPLQRKKKRKIRKLV